MNNLFLITLLTFVLSPFFAFDIYGEEPLWKLASNHEANGNYSEAIRIKKVIANQDKDTEWYIDDLAGIARCYSYLNEVDSTVFYCHRTNALAENLVGTTDSIAEEYIQSSAWSCYRCGAYSEAVSSAERVLALRDKIYGEGSDKSMEWIGVMSYQALQNGDLIGMAKYSDKELKLAEKIHGVNSEYFKGAISSIRGYAHALIDPMPDFTIEWILPYYNKLISENVLPQYQYEFEILLLSGHLSKGNLQLADRYAQNLYQRTLGNNRNIPLEDQVRIGLKLAMYYCRIGDHMKSRIKVEDAWKSLKSEGREPSMAQLIDRHNVEKELRMDTIGRSRINSEWLIATSDPILAAGTEDNETLAFFYESRAWAYEGLEDYDKAISDIRKSISLKPLNSRKKKLAQFYLHKKEYALAEREFLDLLKDTSLSDAARSSVVSDLTFVYWFSGQKDKLAQLLDVDFKNMKSNVRDAFAFLNEYERETYFSKADLGSVLKYDFYTCFSEGESQWPIGNKLAYDMALVQKGLLLSTTKDISAYMLNAPDSLRSELEIYNLYRENEPIEFGYESQDARNHRLKIMNYVAQQPNFMSQLNYTWEQVKHQLQDGEAAIEFIPLWGLSPDNMENPDPSTGALIIRKDSEYPEFVRLSADSAIESLFEYEDEDRLDDLLYQGEKRAKLYNAIWDPLLPYLRDIKTIYYAPTGILQTLNIDWIGNSDGKFLCDEYDLYRLSSTREICLNKSKRNSEDAVLYGDITYAMAGSTSGYVAPSKYRSVTRAGFGPLSQTKAELDSIAAGLNANDYSTQEYRNTIATEESFRAMSGKSPKILHIATHGFYYSQEALEEEFKKSSFMGFQSRKTELYHSGLAMAGAQDSWVNKVEGDEINFDKYLGMDAKTDGILLSSEISDMDLSGIDLVVMSACQSALGKVNSEGVYGLQRAFKLAGVNSIVMSLWKVDDEATQLLMTDFYQNLMAGRSKRESLLAAQKTVRDTPGFEDPYYWAAFILLDGLN